MKGRELDMLRPVYGIGIIMIVMVLLITGCGNGGGSTGDEKDIDKSATEEDFLGAWEGSIAVSSNGTSGDFDSKITLTAGNSLNGIWYDLSDQSSDTISGTVSDGIFSFELPVGSITPGCAQWNMPMEAALNAAHTVMTMNGSGTACSGGGGIPGTVSGSFTRTSN